MGASYFMLGISNVSFFFIVDFYAFINLFFIFSTLSTSVPSDQSVPIFTGVFVIVWLGAAVVTLNAKLLGGSV